MNQSDTEQSPEDVPNSANALPDGSMMSAFGVPLVTALALTVAIGGGYACGLAIVQFSELGSVFLWALGAVAGYVGRKIITNPNRAVGWLLACACVLAFVVAETCWIHWETKQGAESWWAAFMLLPTFVQQYQIAALAGSIFTLFGAHSAYRQTATSRRLV